MVADILAAYTGLQASVCTLIFGQLLQALQLWCLGQVELKGDLELSPHICVHMPRKNATVVDYVSQAGLSYCFLQQAF